MSHRPSVTDYMTMPSNSTLAQLFHRAASTHCPLLSRRLWRSICRRPFSRAASNPQKSQSDIPICFHSSLKPWNLALWTSLCSSIFKCFINDVLREYVWKFVIVYIDDILIYSPDSKTPVITNYM